MIQTSFFPQPKKDEPIKIIQIDPSGLQPRKVEELKYKNCADVIPDTYMLYPTGGYHPFYGTPNTLPRYQLPIWPFVKRIKWDNENKTRSTKIEGQLSVRISPKKGYQIISFYIKGYFMGTDYTRRKKNGQHVTSRKQKRDAFTMHGLIAHAYIPNPEKKPHVMHINEDPTNFLPENLKWGTPGESMRGVKKMLDTPEQKYLNLVNTGLIKG